MKKVLIVFVSIILIILAAAFIIPIVFKDEIKTSIDEALAESVNADIVWDDLNISLFTNFPNATAALENFGIINRAPFEGEILFAVKQFEVEVDLFSLFGDQIKIRGIAMDRPEIFVKVLPDGTANYDIAIADETASVPAETDTAAAEYNVGIDHWQITDGHLVYEDQSIPFLLELQNLQHAGSGDFTQDIFDLTTSTTADSVTVNFDGTEYVTDKHVEIEAVLAISDEYSRYTFKENNIKINDFNMSFDGYLALLEDGSMDMDINYGTRENTFKSLLSLVPGVYTDDFKDIKTDGSLTFRGGVKGKFDSLSLPAFNLTLRVEDAMFKYPDLPTAVTNINMDLLVNNKDGNIDNTSINLKNLHMDFGDNPLDAKLLVKNLRNYDLDAEVKGNLNLEQLNSMFPMEGMTMKGRMNIDLKASGIYDSVKQVVPAIDATITMDEGYVKTADFPSALENVSFNARITDETGRMRDFKALIKDFTMVIDNEPFDASLTLENLDNYTWDLSAKGGVDLEKIDKLLSLKDMILEGKIYADLETKGKMSDLEAERYGNLPTSGTITIEDFKYSDKELPYDVTIATAKASFDPRRMTLSNYEGTVGRSDMQMNGMVTNYIGYMFGENQLLKGTMNFKSKLLDLNEFMSEEDDAQPAEEEEAESYGVIQVPENIDFVLRSEIETARIMDMEVTDAKGTITVRDGVVNLSDLKFNLLGGAFDVSGAYDARNKEKPEYNFDMGIEDLSIQKAFQTFTLVQNFAPAAKLVNGNVSTDFEVSGLLDQSMMPQLSTTSGGGLLKIAQATVENSKIVNGITSLTKLDNVNEIKMRDVKMAVNIEEGKLKVEPFDVQLGNFKTTISGVTALDGSIAYAMDIDLPASKLGSQFSNLIGAGQDGTIPVTIGIGGTYNNPQPKLMMGEQKEQVKEAVTDKAKEEIKDRLGDVKNDKAREVIGELLGNDEKDTTRTDSTKTKKSDLKEKVEKEAKDRIRDLFNRK